jgi:hypothetical protein
MCADCVIGDYQAAHPECVTCCSVQPAEVRETPDLRWEKTRLKDVIWALLIQVYGGRPLNSLADTDVPQAIDALIEAAARGKIAERSDADNT